MSIYFCLLFWSTIWFLIVVYILHPEDQPSTSSQMFFLSFKVKCSGVVGWTDMAIETNQLVCRALQRLIFQERKQYPKPLILLSHSQLSVVFFPELVPGFSPAIQSLSQQALDRSVSQLRAGNSVPEVTVLVQQCKIQATKKGSLSILFQWTWCENLGQRNGDLIWW